MVWTGSGDRCPKAALPCPLTRTGRPADSVDINLWEPRGVVVDDHLHSGHVQAPGGKGQLVLLSTWGNRLGLTQSRSAAKSPNPCLRPACPSDPSVTRVAHRRGYPGAAHREATSVAIRILQILDLNLARAAKRSFCTGLGENWGARGQVTSQQMFECSLCEAWGQDRDQDSPHRQGITVQQGRWRWPGEGQTEADGWQEECSRQREEPGHPLPGWQAMGFLEQPEAAPVSSWNAEPQRGS